MPVSTIALDASFLVENCFLIEKDFNSLARRFLKAINPVQTRNIRKLINFESVPYDKYVNEYSDLDPSSPDPFDIEFDPQTIPLMFIGAANSSFFPAFEDEFFMAFTPIDHEMCKEVDGLRSLHTSNFRSLCLAAYELEMCMREKFACCSLAREINQHMEVIFSFLIPFYPEVMNFDVTIVANVNFV